MCSFKSIYFVIFILNLYETHAAISDKRLCIDPECKEPVSHAKTLLRYSSPDPRILSFAPNAEVTIYSKEAGSETTLWGAVINGKRGYVPKHLVREYRVYKKKPTLLVDTELNQKPQVPAEANKNDIEPDTVKQSYEVVDGTTIYLNPQDNISPSSTETPILSTPLPSVHSAEEQAVSEDPKEKDTTKKDDAQESVFGKVSSSFSKWINDDTDSEEFEEEDEDEDDEDEDDEGEESLEEDLEEIEKNSEEKPQDINSLHNLPAGVKISPYSLEINQSVNDVKDAVKENEEQKAPQELDQPKPAFANAKEEIVQTTDASTEKHTVETAELKKNEELKKDLEPTADINTANEMASPTNGAESQKPIESEKNEQLNQETVNIDTVNETTPPTIEAESEKPKESEKKEQLNQETANINTVNERTPLTNAAESKTLNESEKNEQLNQETANINAVDESTPPTNEVENEKPNQSEKTEQPNQETTNINLENAPESVTEPSINVEEEQLPILDETTPNPLNLKEPDVKTDQDINEPSPDTKENKNIEISPAVTNEHNILDLPEETVPISVDSPSADSHFADNSQKDSNEHKEETQNTEGQQENVPSEVPGDSEEKIVNIIEDNSKEAESVEVSTASNLENEIVIDNTTHDQDQIEESVKIEVNDEPQNNIENNAEILPEQPIEENSEEPVELSDEEAGGIWSGLFSFFGSNPDDTSSSTLHEYHTDDEKNAWVPQAIPSDNYCDATSELCNVSQEETLPTETSFFDNIDLKFNSDFFLLLITTAGSVIVFLFVYMLLDRHKREAPLVARINKLERELLVTLKENELLQEKGTSAIQDVENIPNEVVEQLAEAQIVQQALQEKIKNLEALLEDKAALEEQIESLEKELETSTEVGMELNRIISEMLDPTNGSDRLKENVEQLQRQLLEQKDTINSISETLREKEAENRMLRDDLDKSKKLAVDLQSKMEEAVEKMLKIEREQDQQQNTLQKEIAVYRQRYNEAVAKEEVLTNDLQVIRVQLAEVQRQVDMKTKEYQTLKESLNKIKSLKNDGEALRSLLDATSIKAEIQQLKSENASYIAQLQQEQALKVSFEKKYQSLLEEINLVKEKYEQADKEKVEVNSKLEVLNNYFKKRESELQEEIIKYKSIWDAKEGEATSTTERMKYMREEIENYKAQNETLKQEIMSQEIDLKSQISVLEKKVHENWVTARQTERKLEDAKQEAAQLRNRLTLRERAINEERMQNRLQSPVEQNGELPLSPHPIDSPASPPLLYGTRDHITKSPPLPGLPPFLPPPPGAPFMPPPLHGMPPFMPPPPSMFPGDHRPPPLGRMSSPPLNSRYSPDTSAFSPYNRRSPSPPYDSEYGASPPSIRGYSPYNSRDDRREYKRPPHGRTNGRNAKGPVMSSGSDHSNDSLDKISRKQSKMV